MNLRSVILREDNVTLRSEFMEFTQYTKKLKINQFFANIGPNLYTSMEKTNQTLKLDPKPGIPFLVLQYADAEVRKLLTGST